MARILMAGFMLFLVVSNCFAEEYSLVTDKEGRTYRHWKMGSDYPNGRAEQLANLDKVKPGISSEEFIKLIGVPNKKEEKGELKVYFYIVAVNDSWANSQEERERPGKYLPDYDLEWEPFFFRNNVFIGCGKKIQNEVNKQYGTKYGSTYVRFGCQRPEELSKLCCD